MSTLGHAATPSHQVTHGSWEPGDPLYTRPRGVGAMEQHIRHMVQLLDDSTLHAPADSRGGDHHAGFRLADLTECTRCRVWWNDTELGPACWFCGRDRTGINPILSA